MPDTPTLTLPRKGGRELPPGCVARPGEIAIPPSPRGRGLGEGELANVSTISVKHNKILNPVYPEESC